MYGNAVCTHYRGKSYCMKTDYQNTSMLDIVFENRNKNYGAYQLRQSRDKSLQLAIFVTVCLVSLSLSGYYLSQRLHHHASDIYTKGEIILTDIDLPKPPVNPPPPQPQTVAAAKQTVRDPEVRVVQDNNQVTDSMPDRSLLAQVESGLTTNLSNNTNPLGVTDGKGNKTDTIEVKQTVISDPPILTTAEEMPEFPGGEEALLKFISKNTSYPGRELDLGIEGKAFIKFVVNEDGSVSNASVIKSASPGFGQEGMRVVSKLPNFKPGKQHGKAVKVYYILPFQFKQQ